jgi:succinate dehydrogenase flavin-adding protein (antitoxin of CptAB toxin-antitoxin module)
MTQSIADLIFDKSRGNPQLVLYILRFIDADGQSQTLNDDTIEEYQEHIPCSRNELLEWIQEMQNTTTQELECTNGAPVEYEMLAKILQRAIAKDLAAAQQGGLLESSNGSL